VASPVVAVVALDNFIILRLLDHLDLVNASFAVAAGPGPRHLIEADAITVAGILSVRSQGGEAAILMVALVMMTVAVILRTAPRIEGEGVDQRSLLPVFRRSNGRHTERENQSFNHPHF